MEILKSLKKMGKKKEKRKKKYFWENLYIRGLFISRIYGTREINGKLMGLQ